MDDKMVEYSESRYNEIKTEIGKFLQKTGFKPKRTPFIPISGWDGDNIVEKSGNMPWYCMKGKSV